LPGGHRGSVYADEGEIAEWRAKVGLHDHSDADNGSRGRTGYRWVAVAGLALLGLAGVLAVLPRRGHTPLTSEFRVVPLTALPGDERWPSLSPDGRRVAFGWRKDGGDQYDLYVIDVGGVAPVRVSGKLDSTPVFSNGGEFIAFQRMASGRARLSLMTVPAAGGAEHQVAEIALNVSGRLPPQVAWTKDNQWLITADRDDDESPFHLSQISIATGEKRVLTRPPAGYRGDQAPVVSPDGNSLAFIRVETLMSRDIWFLSLAGPDNARTPQQATFERCCVLNPMWTTSGRDILYRFQNSLFRLPVAGRKAGKPAMVSALGLGSGFSKSLLANRMVFTTSRYDEDIWRLNLRPPSASVRLMGSTRTEHMPAISPNGRGFAYSSDRSGAYGIWTSAWQDSSPVLLASPEKEDAFTPHWSPDGRWIAFVCGSNICIVPASGGNMIRATTQSGRDVLPSWSRDSKWLYFGSSRAGKDQIFKMAIAADGRGSAPVQLTKGGGYGGVESYDGKTFYYGKSEQSGEIWSVAVNGGIESPLPVPLRYFQRPENFDAAPSGLYSLAWLPEERSFELLHWRFASNAIKRIAKLKGMPGTGLSVAPDESFILYASGENRSGDLILIDNINIPGSF
jgi:Tol biopolymer transport system component